jgi:general stress protein CsbA
MFRHIKSIFVREYHTALDAETCKMMFSEETLANLKDPKYGYLFQEKKWIFLLWVTKRGIIKISISRGNTFRYRGRVRCDTSGSVIRFTHNPLSPSSHFVPFVGTVVLIFAGIYLIYSGSYMFVSAFMMASGFLAILLYYFPKSGRILDDYMEKAFSARRVMTKENHLKDTEQRKDRGSDCKKVYR